MTQYFKEVVEHAQDIARQEKKGLPTEHLMQYFAGVVKFLSESYKVQFDVVNEDLKHSVRVQRVLIERN